MKILIMPKSIKQINSLIDIIDGVIVGLDSLCINMPYSFNLDEIKKIIDICKSNNKEVFISLNKNIHNRDLEYLKECLVILDNFNINGILYYDLSIVNIKNELNLNTPLVWHQEHLTTNYLTSNYWYDEGAIYTYLSSEITIDEINEISKNSKAKTMVTMFGYLPMFVSRRHLVKNYLDTFNLEDNSEINYIEKEGKMYQIIDTEDGTIAYSEKVLNGLGEIFRVRTDYIVLNSFSIDDNVFSEVTYMFRNVNEENIIEYNGRINSMLDTDLGFLYKETIYKVKNNE